VTKVLNLWPDGKITCPECKMKITITPSPYKEYHCPGCGEIFTVVSEDDELFRECEEEDDP
jgi:DNA-directed RNA polymerase subunit RPC12/RpoP